MLGDYAVKKVPVGDNRIWLRKMVREVGAAAAAGLSVSIPLDLGSISGLDTCRASALRIFLLENRLRTGSMQYSFIF